MPSKSPESILLLTVQVMLINGKMKIRVNASLDDASTTTYVNADIVDEQGLTGHLQHVYVSIFTIVKLIHLKQCL